MIKLFKTFTFLYVLLLISYSCNDNLAGRADLDFTDYSATATTTDTEETEDDTETIYRPSGAIQILASSACICSEGSPISIGSQCDSVCASRQSASDETRMLYFEVSLNSLITEDYIGDMQGFCSALEEDDTDVTPNCYLEVKDPDGNVVASPSLAPSAGQVRFSQEVDGVLDDGVTYRVAIVEAVSEARSTTVQVRVTPDLIEDTIGGVLALEPINEYMCLLKATESDTFNVTSATTFHFYFNSETRPDPLLESSMSAVYCHDIDKYGTTPISSPLLSEQVGIFTLWDSSDPRFYAYDDGDDALQIHKLIEQNMTLYGAAPDSTPTYFYKLNWPSAFDDGDVGTGTDDSSSINLEVVNSDIGYYMTPFINSTTKRAYCPTAEHFYSDNIIFKSMREFIGEDQDTEALYVAKQENVCDFILVKESLLKQIWFYEEGGQNIKPTDSTVSGNKIQFYWPADTASPYIKKSHQKVYTVKRATEVACGDATLDDASSSSTLPTHDRRIGCIPKLQ